MPASGRISDGELLRALLANTSVRVAAIDRAGRFLLEPDPNPPRSTDDGAPAGGRLFDVYPDVSGLNDAVVRAFAGETVHLTRHYGGATHAVQFIPRRQPSGDIDAVIIVSTADARGGVLAHELAEMQKRERLLFNAGMVGLIYWTRDGAITDANDAFLAMVGYSREDLTCGRLDWRAMTPPEYASYDDRALAQMKERGTSDPFEKQYLTKDGRRIDVLLAGSLLGESGGGVAFALDVSARKRDERQRRDAEELLRRVVDAAPIVLWSTNAEGIFTLSTGRGLAALGLTSGQVVGRSLHDLYADFPEILSASRQALAGEEVYKTVEIGEAVFEALFSPLRDAAGAVTGVLGVAFDVTPRRRIEAERERLQAQLLQAQKLESLGLLAGGIAHDFNNILTPILGAAATAELSLPPAHPAREDLEIVVTAAQRAAGLTRQMLAYAGRAQVEIRAIELSAQVHEIGQLLETSVPKKVRLELAVEGGLPAVEADASQVQQVIMNLVINGAEAIGAGEGTVRVTTGRGRLDAAELSDLFAGEVARPGEFVFLQVEDTGAGMDEATRARIFDPFFTTKFTGRGLGLAAVLGIVRAHRGAISVASNPGRGTTFRVYFPASQTAARKQPGAVASAYRGEGLVLVIDDDAGVRQTTSNMLRRYGFQVMTADDGHAGVQAFARHPGDLALVIVDMTMPRMGGEETFRALRAIRGDVPVILISGYNEVEATRRLVAEGRAAFLEKPFAPADLAAKLAAVLPHR